MRQLLAAMALGALFAAPSAGLTLSFSGTVEGTQTPFEGQQFLGAVIIDPGAPVIVQGDSRRFIFIPEGTLELQIGSLSFAETISAVSASEPREGGARFLGIHATPLRPSTLSSASLEFFPPPGEDPFSVTALGPALDSVAAGCCTASFSFTPLSGPAVTTTAAVRTSIPEPSTLAILAVGFLILSEMRGRHP